MTNIATNIRPLLEPTLIDPAALDKISAFHPETVHEVEEAVRSNPLVVIGMAQNPHVKACRKALDDAGLTYRYLEYGSYFSEWKKRLAIKLWSGWPTFPQVYVHGRLLGGKDLTLAALADGTLKARLEKS